MKYFLDEPIAGFVSTLSLPEGDPLLFAYVRGNLVLDEKGAVPGLARALEGGVVLASQAPLGVLDGRACVVAVVDAELPSGFAAKSLRRLFGGLEMNVLSVAAVASQYAHFLATNRHCGVCGGAMKQSTKDRTMRCDVCGRDVYPLVAPCVIVLVHDGARILLTREARFPPGMYGLVAGFVEPGETLEACARREMLEETGLVIDELTYVASQPWPFPSQLMVGYLARYVSGEVVVDRNELEEAAWFDLDRLPMIPPPFSVAYHLIEHYKKLRSAAASP